MYLNLGVVVFKSIFVHDPIGLLAMGSSAGVEDEGFPHANPLGGGAEVNGFVPPRRLPEPGPCGAVGPGSRRILLVLVAEEVPLVLRTRPDSALVCISQMDPSIFRTNNPTIDSSEDR